MTASAKKKSRAAEARKKDDSRAAQIAALCFRRRKSGKDVLLVTSRGTGRWILPKGWPMKGKSDAEAARIEAWEEAGVKAKSVSDDPLGRFDYVKDVHEDPVDVVTEVYPLEVADMKQDFPEAGERERRWLSPKKAAKLVNEPGLKKMLREF